MTLFDLTGRVAIVTGGNGGIGLGMARGLAAAGARIIVAARDPAKSETALAELGSGTKAALSRSMSPMRARAGRRSPRHSIASAASTSSSTMPGCRSASRPRNTPPPNGRPCSPPI